MIHADKEPASLWETMRPQAQQDSQNICKKLSLLATALLFILIMPPAAYASIPSSHQKPTPLCKLLSQKKTYKSFSKAKIKEMQRALYVTGYDAEGVDGFIGPNTRDAMRRFCIDFTIETPKDLANDYADILLHYAAIAELYPNWKEIILDPGFGEWIERQPVKRRTEIYKIRRSGTPRQIISLFKRYKQDLKYGDAPFPESRLENPDDYKISFKLTGKDLDELRALLVSEAIVEQVGKMQDEPYESKTKFLNAVEGKIKEATDNKGLSKRFRDQVLKLSEETWAIKLTEETFNKLKAKGTPDDIIKQLVDLKDIPYADKMALNKAVEAKFQRVTNADEALVSKRVKTTTGMEEGPSFMLNERFFKKMKLAEVPAFLLDALQELKDFGFTEKRSLEKKVAAIVAEMTGTLTDDKKCEEYVKQINGHAEEVTKFKLTRDELEKLRAEMAAKYVGDKSFAGRMKTLYYKAKFLLFDRVEKIMVHLAKVQDESFSTTTRLYNATGLKAGYLKEDERQLIANHARQPSVYILGEKTFNNLKVEELAPTVLKQIEPLRGLEYPERKKLELAVESKIRKVTDEEKSMIFDHVEALKPAATSSAYKLTEQFFKELELKKLPAQLIGSLTPLKELDFDSRKELEKEALKAVEKAKDHYAAFVKFRPYILKYSEESETFEVTVQAVSELENELKEMIVPEVVLDMLPELKDVEYIDKALFKNALKLKIEGLTARYESIVLKEIEKLPSVSLTEDFFTNIADGGVPDQITEGLLGLGECTFFEKKEIEAAAKRSIDEATGDYKHYASLIIMQARKRHRYKDFKAKPIEWSGGDCGCSRSDLSGVIYGFYPFWMAGKGQTLDFSALTRVGYFALPFDKKGNLWPKLHWEKERAAFLNTARKYNTEVDLVIYNNNWKLWKRFDDRLLDKLAGNIVSSVDAKADNSLLNRFKPYISVGTSSVPAMGDGVTLYFDFSTADKEEQKEISSSIIGFIELLSRKLKAADGGYFLNVMLSMSEMEGDIYSLNNLKELVPAMEFDDVGYAEKDIVDLFLVFMEESSVEKKKELRRAVEKDFKGIQRKNFLRKIVPVISPSAYREGEEDRLHNDLIYFEDNFRGVGLWPVPVVEGGSEGDGEAAGGDGGGEEAADGEAEGSTYVNTVIVDEFEETQDADFLKSALLDKAPWYCNFVCPNRWPLRIVLDLLAAMLALYALLAIWFCDLRRIFREYFLWFFGVAAVTVFIFFSMLICDPFMSDKRDELIVGLVLISIFISIGFYVRKMKQGDMP